MSFNASQLPKGNNNNKPKAAALAPGGYPGRLVALMTLGVQPQRPFKGEEKPPALELSTTYEFADEFLLDDDGNPDEEKPRWLSETFTFNHLDKDKATSTKRYLALDPNKEWEGDWSKLVGAPVMINVANYVDKNGVVKDKISATSVIRAKDAAKMPPLVNDPRIFDFYNPDVEVFLSLPDWLQEKIKSAVDFPGGALEQALQAHGPKKGGDDKPKQDKAPAAKKQAPVAVPENDENEDEIPW